MPTEHRTKSGTVYYTSTPEELAAEAAEEAKAFAAAVGEWRASGEGPGKGRVVIERSPEAQAKLEERRAREAAAAAAVADAAPSE